MDILQLTYSGTHIHHSVNSTLCATVCEKRIKINEITLLVQMRGKKREEMGFIGG